MLAEEELLRRAYAVALDAVQPAKLLPPFLNALGEHSPAVVLGAGKAAAAMAAAFHATWRSTSRGLVVTRYEHGLLSGEDAGGIEILEAGHPSPDQASLAAGAKMLRLARSLSGEERLFFLISGGGSALAAGPLPAVGFERKRGAANFLIRAGADIREINCVRKHLSSFKGGRLAVAAHPAPVVTYAISDVPGDNVADIASGPTVPDATTQDDAIAVLRAYRYPQLQELLPYLQDPRLESPKPGDPAFDQDRIHLIAAAATALRAAATAIAREGYKVLTLGDDLDDEARALGREHARLAKAQLATGERVAILSGGETRVVLSNSSGRGGRNLEYLSGLALELAGQPGVYALAADTDGIDGDGDHAGGVVAPDSLARAKHAGVELESALAEHDSYAFFDACGTLIKTGPTRTNVNDFRLILCDPTKNTTQRL
jgi:glycerate 2-kinase